ncbi:MAG: Yip1 family protein, partial [Vicinamibacterales bacterium]
LASYVSALVSTLLAALVLERLAPRFQSHGDTAQTLKLVAYASTPVWVGGIVYLVIVLSPLIVVAGLYAIYLFYVGLPYVMKTPPEQVVPFMVVAAIAIVVLSIILRYAITVVGVPAYF